MTKASSENGRTGINRLVERGGETDERFDVIVVGSGSAAYSAALHAADAGAKVVMLEKAERFGGTTFKSHGWFWMANNRFMRERGIDDPKDQALEYMARLARPALYQPDSPTLGLPQEEYDLLDAFYDVGDGTVESLVEMDALDPISGGEIPDYYSRFPEDVAPYGRAMMPAGPPGEDVGYGNDLIAGFRAAADRLGIDQRPGHRVVRALVDSDGGVVGVVAETPEGEVSFGAAGGVVFGSGGFGSNPEMLRNFLPGPVFGSCSAISNEGDFVDIAAALGAPLRNMNQAWCSPQTFEKAVKAREAGDPDFMSLFSPPGDSMVWVNRYGKRVVNEKGMYPEVTPVFWTWDPYECEWPNMLMFMIWDEECDKRFSGAPNRADNPIAPAGANRDHIVSADTLEELAQAFRERLAELTSKTGGFTLAEFFEEGLSQTLERFNANAAKGVDPDFHRGEFPFEAMLQAHNGGAPRPGNEDSPVLHPLAETGPYHGIILSAGTLDTKGGPRIDTKSRVLDGEGMPIPGLYGAGNCIASPALRGYFGAGGTIGFALAFGKLAGIHAAGRASSAADGNLTAPRSRSTP